MKRVCGYLRAALLLGLHARAEVPLIKDTQHCTARSSPMASQHGHTRLNYLHGKDPGPPSRNPGIISEDEGSKRSVCLEKETRGRKGDFITEICQRESLIT